MQYHKIENIWVRDMESGTFKLDTDKFRNEAFAALATVQWQWHEKLDGMNMRVHLKYSGFWDRKVFGKTDRAQIPGDLLEWMNGTLHKDCLMSCFNIDWLRDSESHQPIILYGEGVGAGIQGGGKYGQTKHFVLFDIRRGDKWLSQDVVSEVANKLGIERAAWRGQGTIDQAKELVSREHFRTLHGNPNDYTQEAEGLILRPLVELTDQLGGRVIAKLKRKDVI